MLARFKRKLAIKRPETGSPNGKGQSLVEMAIIAPLLLLLFIGVLEVGWAIRGYVVLLNADREATRFAAKGQYLRFDTTDVEDIGYGSVLSQTLASMSRQLDFDVLSDDPNGTLIISHYLVDTQSPCEDPPCNEKCRDKNKPGGCDCTTPDRREDDYGADDLVLHPGMDGYGHLSMLYGIPRESRLNHEQIVADLKEQNDAFNCRLNVQDPSAPWSDNSVVIVEAFYAQPQLLGVPLISNYLTDPIPLYANTMMRITGGQEAKGCALLPIAIHEDTLDGLEEGESTGNIRNGTGTGQFGWLSWTHESEYFTTNPNSAEYLAEELNNPLLSRNDYDEPGEGEYDPEGEDTVINQGDWVWGLTGNVNSDAVRDQLDIIIGDPPGSGGVYYVPVWDTYNLESGSNVVYHIVRFAKMRLTDYNLTTNDKSIWGTFEGWVEDGDCVEGNKH
jgi:hypothetical protein